MCNRGLPQPGAERRQSASGRLQARSGRWYLLLEVSTTEALMDKSPWRCACDAVNSWAMAFCDACGLERPSASLGNFPVTGKVHGTAYREPATAGVYVEPTEAEQREIRIKLGETIDKLRTAMTAPGRGILHERGQERRAGEWTSRFATDAERQQEAQRQLEAFKAWQEGQA